MSYISDVRPKKEYISDVRQQKEYIFDVRQQKEYIKDVFPKIWSKKMTRSKLREQTFKMLFRMEFHDAEEMDEQLGLFEEESENISEKESAYLAKKCQGVFDHVEEIDSAINEVAKGWKTSRMSKVDLTVLRLAVYEIRLEENIPFKVSVNEAVELVKQYGTQDSASFVNGILAKFAS